MQTKTEESPRIMEELKHRGNTLVKFFKYKDIKQKYRKGKKSGSLPAALKQVDTSE